MTSATTFSNASEKKGWSGQLASEFPALAEAGPWKSGGNTRASSASRDEAPAGKKKWVPIPAAEMQAALDQVRSQSHSRTSSRRNSPGEMRRGRRLPDDNFRRKSGLNTPSGSLSVSKQPSPAPPQPTIKRKSPRNSAPITSLRPIPPLTDTSRFGSIDTPSSPPPDSQSRSDITPKQPGRYGVAIGVPLEERNARRAAARRPLTTDHDIEDDWTGDGRWNFGVLGTFDRRAPLSRTQHLPPPTIHSPRARGARGRGMTRGYRGRGYPPYRGSPADSDYAMLPVPMDPYNPYFAPYPYQGYVPVPPMWNPYAPYPVMPPPPPPILGTGAAPLPVPVTNPGYPLDPMRYYVLGQVEYYFSVQNMCQDLYLRQQMDTQGWIPISTISSFNRLRKLTQDANLVREMMQISSLVEVSADGEKARMAANGWTTFVLPDAQDSGEAEPSASMDEETSALGLVVDPEGN